VVILLINLTLRARSAPIKTAIQTFEQEADHGQDPELKAFAQKILPTLKEHLELANNLNEKTAAEEVGVMARLTDYPIG